MAPPLVVLSLVTVIFVVSYFSSWSNYYQDYFPGLTMSAMT
jgi:hypothetical protein